MLVTWEAPCAAFESPWKTQAASLWDFTIVCLSTTTSWQMGLEGVKAARARKASSKATGSDNLVSRMHEASMQKGMHDNI